MEIDLVFEGGGAKGIVFAGAMDTFFKRGFSCGRLLGTSAGAISATLLAAGYSVEEVIGALSETGSDGRPVFAGFMGHPRPFTAEELAASSLRGLLQEANLPFVPGFARERILDALFAALMRSPTFRHLFAFIERGGWYSADAFVAWLQQRLDAPRPQGEQRAYSRLTLAQFHQASGADLSLVAADTTGQQMLVLNHRTAPDCPLVYAVRMSMSVPLLWDEVEWRAEWGSYRGRDIAGHIIVDGGLLSNFPLELFVSDAPLVTAVMGRKTADHALGLFIDESLPVAGAPARPQALGGARWLPSLDRFKTVNRLQALVETVTQARDKSIMDAFSHLVIRLPAGGYGTTEFDMTPERREALVNAGCQAMAAYLDNPPAPLLGTIFESSGMADEIADRVALNMLGE
jgi:NTE family protein